MNPSIVNPEVMETAATSVVPAISSIGNPLIASFKAMPTTAKVAVGAGAAGIVIGGGYLGYRTWKKHHSKPAPAPAANTNTEQQPKAPTLDDEADEFEDEETEEQIRQGETLTAMHEMGTELTVKLYKAGFTDKGALMAMVCTVLETTMKGDPGYKFVEAAVDAGIAVATAENSNDQDEGKK